MEYERERVDRVPAPPHSEDAEIAVLSAMLMDQDAVIRASEFVDGSMFYQERHRRIFRAMVALAEKAVTVDPLTLSDELTSKGELEASGGKDFIGYLVDAVPTSANIEHHAAIVRERFLRRTIIAVSTELIQEAHRGQVTGSDLLDLAEAKVFQISQERRQQGPLRIKEMLWPTMERLEARVRSGRTVTGVATGFADLDELTSGLQPADLVIIGARPSMGKTALCLNIAQHAAIDDKVPVAIFSLEMSKEALTERMLSSEARVDSQRMRRGMIRDDEFPMLARAAGILSSAPIYIDDSSGLSVLEMRSKARRLKTEDNIGLIIVDYLQLMVGSRSAENRQQEVSEISRGLKALAKELGVPVVALSQLSRASENRTGDHRPQLSDLRESGAIEQDADLIAFLYREEMYVGPVDSDGNSIEGKAELIIGKQRNGPTGTVNLHFYKQYTRFADWSPRQPS